MNILAIKWHKKLNEPTCRCNWHRSTQMNGYYHQYTVCTKPDATFAAIYPTNGSSLAIWRISCITKSKQNLMLTVTLYICLIRIPLESNTPLTHHCHSLLLKTIKSHDGHFLSFLNFTCFSALCHFLPLPILFHFPHCHPVSLSLSSSSFSLISLSLSHSLSLSLPASVLILPCTFSSVLQLPSLFCLSPSASPSTHSQLELGPLLSFSAS